MRIVSLIILALLLSFPAFAGNERIEVSGDDACMLYYALNSAEEFMPSDDEEYTLHRKDLSGLACFKWETDSTDSTCQCIFDEGLTYDQKEGIYEGIDAWEKHENDLDTNIYTKRTGDIFFTKTTYVKFDRLMTDYEFSVL